MQNSDQLPKPKIAPTVTHNEQYDLDDVWKITLENVRLYVSAREFNAWFKDLLLEKIEAGMAEISCDQAFRREWIETYHRALIRKALKEATGQDLQIVISVRSSVRKKKAEE